MNTSNFMNNKEQKKEERHCDGCKIFATMGVHSFHCKIRDEKIVVSTIPTPPKALREEELNEKLVCLACKHEICPSCKLGCHNVDCEDSVSPIKICYDNLIGNQEKTTPRYSQNELDFLLKQDRERIKEKVEGKLEKWADLEHDRWSKWQAYMHSKLQRRIEDEDFMRLPIFNYSHWERQIKTPYSELSEKEKESDREQVKPYIDDFLQILDEEQL